MKSISTVQNNILKMISQYVGKNIFIFYLLHIKIMKKIETLMTGKIGLMRY